MFNSEKGGLYAAIGGIALVYSIDCVTRYNYRADIKRDSVTLSPAGSKEEPKPQEPEKKSPKKQAQKPQSKRKKKQEPEQKQ